MEKEDFEKLIDKHIELCKKYGAIFRGIDEENAIAFAGGVTALTLLKRELNGEREY